MQFPVLTVLTRKLLPAGNLVGLKLQCTRQHILEKEQFKTDSKQEKEQKKCIQNETSGHYSHIESKLAMSRRLSPSATFARS